MNDQVSEDLNKVTPPPNPVQLSEAKELELSLNLNLSMAELKLENWAAAIKVNVVGPSFTIFLNRRPF